MTQVRVCTGWVLGPSVLRVTPGGHTPVSYPAKELGSTVVTEGSLPAETMLALKIPELEPKCDISL